MKQKIRKTREKQFSKEKITDQVKHELQIREQKKLVRKVRNKMYEPELQ